MGKFYNGKMKSLEATKSLYFSVLSNYSCLHARVTDIVLCPTPQLHQSSILQNSTLRCSLESPPCWEENFQSWWVQIVYMEITFHLSQKFCLFWVEFCLSFRTLLYQFSNFINHIKCGFQQWNIEWYGIVKSKSIMTSIILPEACFRRMAGHSPSGMPPSRLKSSTDDR